jgi:hypothetical protein
MPKYFTSINERSRDAAFDIELLEKLLTDHKGAEDVQLRRNTATFTASYETRSELEDLFSQLGLHIQEFRLHDRT